MVCRLFGLHAGAHPVSATFWLLDAPDSLAQQSHRNPDGAGIGRFDGSGPPVVDKQPLAAWQDPAFARAARTMRGTTFVAHVRYASSGARTVANTHPFVQEDRLFAHNGVIEGLDRLDDRLARLGARELVRGETDSERIFALITAETAGCGGDVQQALTNAVRWIAAELPVYSLNVIVATATDLFALRYPDTRELYVLERSAGAQTGRGHLDVSSHRIHAMSTQLSEYPSVIIASEPMDDDDWTLMMPGELVHVGQDLVVERTMAIGDAPRHQLTIADLNPLAARSQRPRIR